MKIAAAAGACAAGLVALAACGGAARGPATPSAADAGPGGGADGGASHAADPLPSLAALAARGPTDAPLMREALRVEQAAPRSPDVRAERDLCLRAIFAASAPARAWFVDQAGAVRGEITSAAAGTVPPRGPACAQKGESLHLVVEGGAPLTARAVIFAAP
ncbi:MAG TPA: hypothetical protein VLT33_19125 [Labilithrix sp.]|nr:hypothetical protein [Labilithrix sp.]